MNDWPGDPSGRHERVAELFAAAIELNVEARLQFVERACSGYPALLDELLSLLAAHETDGGVLDHGFDPARLAGLLHEHPSDRAPARVGPYRVVRELGRGGMGTVYLAERDDGQYEQRVAIKLVPEGLESPGLIERFLRERRILARLEHANIARLVDGGVTEEGRPYLVMEYVEGEPITTYCDSRRLDVDARLALFEAVCGAVQYAHGNLVVHRDLKPGNILVSAAGVKLLDFGIATLLDAESGAAATLTRGPRPLTPGYAAPEQLRGEAVTTRTDVYGLGAVLYELLSGRRPHDVERGSIEELARVLTDDVAPPSNVRTVATAAARATDPRGLRQRLRGDLDAVALMALHQEPGRRYPSAEALRDDIRRHRTGHPVVARPVSAAQRLARFVRRNRVAAAATAVAVLSVGAGLAATIWKAGEAARQRDLALREADKATRVYNLTAQLFQLATPAQAQGREVTLREALDTGRVWISRELAEQPELRAELDIVLGDVYYALGLFEPALELFEDAVEARRSVFGETYESVSSALLMVGKAHEALGNPDSAEAAARRSLAVLDRLPPYDGRTFLMTHALARLGESLRRGGRLAQAEDTIRYALAILPASEPDAELRRGVLLTTLGHIRRARGDPAGSESMHRQVLRIRRRLWGDNNPEVANALVNVAAAVADQGRVDEAASLYREGLALRRRTQGHDHSEYATDLNGFADFLRINGTLEDARSAYEEALPILRRSLPPDHPRVIGALLGLAATLTELGEESRARSHLDRAAVAVAALRGRAGPDAAEVLRLAEWLKQLAGPRRTY